MEMWYSILLFVLGKIISKRLTFSASKINQFFLQRANFYVLFVKVNSITFHFYLSHATYLLQLKIFYNQLPQFFKRSSLFLGLRFNCKRQFCGFAKFFSRTSSVYKKIFIFNQSIKPYNFALKDRILVKYLWQILLFVHRLLDEHDYQM